MLDYKGTIDSRSLERIANVWDLSTDQRKKKASSKLIAIDLAQFKSATESLPNCNYRTYLQQIAKEFEG